MTENEHSECPSESPTSELNKRYHIPLDVGKVSSVGDVGTIRSQLQKRRIALSQEILVEREITKGSRKLAKMPSLNIKSRDRAALEHQFSVSKIKLLQSELTRINSSLQAYQPESVRNMQIPLIPVLTKNTNRVSFVSSFSEIAKNHYYIDPIAIQDAIYDFQELRFSICTPTKDQSGIDMLYEYLSHLLVVSKRFIHTNLSHGIVFVWHDSINGLPAAQKSTIYEKACVTFNIASLHTQIAAQEDRSTSDGIDRAISSLEKALGVYEYMKHNFSHSPSMDMTPEVLSFFSDLMRAQIIDLQWEKQVLEGLDESEFKYLIEYSQKTKLVSECYRPLRELIEDPPLKEYIPSCWAAVIKIKDGHYKALAHYYAAVIHEKLCSLFKEETRNEEFELHRASITTELHFLYTAETTNLNELFSPDIKDQMGLVKSHLNCATVLHEYALKFKSVCKHLDPVTPLQTTLERAAKRTEELRASIREEESVAMISPTIQPAIIDIHPVIPNFTKVKIQDKFKAIGPLSTFSAEFSWTPPRKVVITKGRSGYGFSIKGSRPVKISGVDPLSSADREDMQVGELILQVNGKDIRSLRHDNVVKLVHDSPDDVLELVVTSLLNDRPLHVSTSVPNSPTTKHLPINI